MDLKNEIPTTTNEPEELTSRSTEWIPTSTTQIYSTFDNETYVFNVSSSKKKRSVVSVVEDSDKLPKGYFPIFTVRISTSKELLSISKEMNIIDKVLGATNSSEN